jgi:hypothetical protein
MTTITKTLTLPQFIATKALASTFHHLWASAIGDNFVLDLQEIDAIASESYDQQFGGITSPTLDEQGNVVHVTGSGRLHWLINSAGNVELNIYRPSGLSAERSQFARMFSYASLLPIDHIVEDGILVARVVTINDDDYNWSWQDDVSVFVNHQEMATPDHTVDYDPNVCSDLLFERHVQALVEPLVALILATQVEGKALAKIVEEGESEYQRWHLLTEEEQAQERDVSYQRYLKYKQEAIDPATLKAEAYLKPLFDIALPDPWYDNDRERPTSFWMPMDGVPTIYHNNEEFPIETERTAARVVVLLRQQPETSLLDAIKTTIATR